MDSEETAVNSACLEPKAARLFELPKRLSAEAQLLEMIAVGCPLPKILDALCREIELELGSGARCAIFLIDCSGLSFQAVVAPNLPREFCEPLRAERIRFAGCPCATAALLKSQLIVSDVESDPHWQKFAMHMQTSGCRQRAYWSTPIESRMGQVLGTVAILQEIAGTPNAGQQALMTRATQVAGIAMEHAQREATVARAEACEIALNETRAQLAYLARVMSLGALSASIAHEIKQPLSGIITNASTCLRMLAAEPPDLVGARETAKRTLRDGNRANDVITKLRALFTRRPVSDEDVNLNRVVEEAAALALGDLQRRRISVTCELDENLSDVRGDRIQLHQVILNLILNAADAMGSIDDRPRRLRILTQTDSEGVLLSITDTGVGLGPNASRIFEPFYTTKTDGMGIGLSISHAIVARHSGRLWATSNEGPGATFTLALPAAARGSRTDRCTTPIQAHLGGGRQSQWERHLQSGHER